MSGRNNLNLNLNHNDHVVSTHNNNLNEIERKYREERDIDTRAAELAGKFNNLDYIDFYRKVVRFYRLNPARIQLHYEDAVKGNPGQPGRLFSYLCKRDGV